MGERTCNVSGCDRPSRAKGWCWTHYQRWYKNGDPLALRREIRPESDRFWPKVDADGDCWLWIAGRNRWGYGRFRRMDGTIVLAHRWCYEHLLGPIAAGLELDHLCRVPACVNPDHLEPVSHLVNVDRGASGKRQRQARRRRE